MTKGYTLRSPVGSVTFDQDKDVTICESIGIMESGRDSSITQTRYFALFVCLSLPLLVHIRPMPHLWRWPDHMPISDLMHGAIRDDTLLPHERIDSFLQVLLQEGLGTLGAFRALVGVSPVR